MVDVINSDSTNIFFLRILEHKTSLSEESALLTRLEITEK